MRLSPTRRRQPHDERSEPRRSDARFHDDERRQFDVMRDRSATFAASSRRRRRRAHANVGFHGDRVTCRTFRPHFTNAALCYNLSAFLGVNMELTLKLPEIPLKRECDGTHENVMRLFFCVPCQKEMLRSALMTFASAMCSAMILAVPIIERYLRDGDFSIDATRVLFAGAFATVVTAILRYLLKACELGSASRTRRRSARRRPRT